MKIMQTITAVCLLILGSLSFMAASPAAEKSKVERGRYIVQGMAACGDCHSPTNEKGEPLPGKDLRGAPLMFKPTVPVPNWADKAPNIAGLPGWEDQAAVKFLMTGIAYNGLGPRPPMPAYRMNKEDAEAVVAYLKSLAPADK
jgi:mono/diheme cytochrome c family protein